MEALQIIRGMRQVSYPGSADQNAKALEAFRDFTQNTIFTQGERFTLNPGATLPVNIQLNSPGRALVGIAVIPIVAGDFNDTDFSFAVNNTNLITSTSAINYDPTRLFVGQFVDTPAPLSGNDTLKFEFLKNNAGQATGRVMVFYLPRAVK